jgi:hypothetical protein
VKGGCVFLVVQGVVDVCSAIGVAAFVLCLGTATRHPATRSKGLLLETEDEQERLAVQGVVAIVRGFASRTPRQQVESPQDAHGRNILASIGLS